MLGLQGGQGVRIALCDDEDAQRQVLRAAIDRHLVARGYRPRYEEYASGEGLIADIATGLDPFDLIFLDIYLKGSPEGVSIAREVREYDPSVPIVFLTVSREHAVESYEVQAAGYLVKPVEVKKLAAVLDRVLPVTSPRLAFRLGTARRYFSYRDIVFLESRDHAVLLHTADGACYRSFTKLDDVQDDLRDPRFLRCHRSCLVNMDYIADVKDDFILRDGTCVPVRVKERRKMHDCYYRYFVGSLCEG